MVKGQSEPATLREKFFRLLGPVPDDPEACWLWTAARIPCGYGSIAHKVDGKWRQVGAHRVSWELHNGDTRGLHVLHACDVKNCVNPAHLYLGDQKRNSRDAKERGLLKKATDLTQEQVVEIRELRASGTPPREIMKQFKISASNLSCIATGTTFADWPGPITPAWHFRRHGRRRDSR